ncbi:protein FAM178B-like, partial [Peromyscus leucopus]|uniref:protein FAM178B-like n=1 Tax=Peromyscus leucopus TaxID=10041 RepID=UPI001884C8E9
MKMPTVCSGFKSRHLLFSPQAQVFRTRICELQGSQVGGLGGTIGIKCEHRALAENQKQTPTAEDGSGHVVVCPPLQGHVSGARSQARAPRSRASIRLTEEDPKLHFPGPHSEAHSGSTSQITEEVQNADASRLLPTDWSPPPVEFLNKNKKVLQACRRPQEDLEKEPPDSDPKVGLASLEELFWNMAGPSQQAVTPKIASGCSEYYVNNLDYLLQEKREQALEQEREQQLQQEHPKLDSSECVECVEDDREAVLTPEHRMLVEKFSVSLQIISPVHPGETVFLPRRHPLPCILDSSSLKPHSQLEELFL